MENHSAIRLFGLLLVATIGILAENQFRGPDGSWGAPGGRHLFTGYAIADPWGPVGWAGLGWAGVGTDGTVGRAHGRAEFRPSFDPPVPRTPTDILKTEFVFSNSQDFEHF